MGKTAFPFFVWNPVADCDAARPPVAPSGRDRPRPTSSSVVSISGKILAMQSKELYEEIGVVRGHPIRFSLLAAEREEV